MDLSRYPSIKARRRVRYPLHGLTAWELGADFDLTRLLNHGYLPRMYANARPARLLDAYVADYPRLRC